MYAECFVRGAGGNGATALGYVNAVRTRANGATINAGGLTMDFILDEREKPWEGHRRTDLVVLENSLEELYGLGKVELLDHQHNLSEIYSLFQL
jgi:hypothetical protein